MNFFEALGNVTVIAELIATGVVAVYTLYAFLVMRQTRMLNEGFNTDSEKFLNFLARGHFLATIALLIAGIIITLA